ncbi:ferredoxin [Schaalia cardiffensis F0333]|uniref:Ferredoxin n=1 Tax=Schaalia cardiffensis F0333 TaxID=888050 RepID=N6XCA5_9ACTO|nr:ferredoxin [Schaalia cardiffensis F0333]
MPSYLFSYRFVTGPRTRACRFWSVHRARGSPQGGEWTVVLSKDHGRNARSAEFPRNRPTCAGQPY